MHIRYRAVPIRPHRILAALLGISASILLAMALWAEPANAATCNHSLQAKIDAASSGATVTADACVYREQVVIKKSLTLQGQPGSEIRGSNIWTAFSQRAGVYVSANVVPNFSASGKCKPSTWDCLKPHQVFLDGKPLRQVASGRTPSAGQFSLDSERHVVLGNDPSGKLVEVSVRRLWVLGRASNVTIKGFEMKHAANDSQWRAALSNEGYANWALQDSSLSYSHGSLVSFRGASGLKILNNKIYQGGHLGVHGSGGAITISGNDIHHNNTSGFDPNWEAGGVKTVNMSSVLAENNHIWGNYGRGLWCDLDCRNVVYRGNRIHHNDGSGILFEISHGAKIYNNVLYENGWRTSPWPGCWEGAIEIYNSRNAEVYNNTVAWNRAGICVVRVERNNAVWNDVYGNYVHDNQILSKDYSSTDAYGSAARNLALGWVDALSNLLLYAAKNNRGYSNDYYFITPESSGIPRYTWDSGITSLASFNRTAGEENGRYLTQSEKNTIVTNKGIPATPEH